MILVAVPCNVIYKYLFYLFLIGRPIFYKINYEYKLVSWFSFCNGNHSTFTINEKQRSFREAVCRSQIGAAIAIDSLTAPFAAV